MIVNGWYVGLCKGSSFIHCELRKEKHGVRSRPGLGWFTMQSATNNKREYETSIEDSEQILLFGIKHRSFSKHVNSPSLLKFLLRWIKHTADAVSRFTGHFSATSSTGVLGGLVYPICIGVVSCWHRIRWFIFPCDKVGGLIYSSIKQRQLTPEFLFFICKSHRSVLIFNK